MIRYFLIFLLLGISSAQAAKIRVFAETADSVHVSLYGAIEQGDDERFMVLMHRHAHKRKKVLYLNSGGGLLGTSLMIGMEVRNIGMTTVIARKKRCESACSNIFVAGWNRILKKPHRIKHPNSKLGVHHPWSKDTRKRVGKKTVQSLKIYLNHMNASGQFNQMTIGTSPRRMRYVKNKELRRMGGYLIQTGKIKWPVGTPPSRHYAWNGCDQKCQDIHEKK